MAQDQVVPRHGSLWALFLEEVAFFSAFAEDGFREMDMVDIGTLGGLRRRVLRSADTCEQDQDEKQPTNAVHSFLQLL
jgi:hypothetical protein